MTDLQAINMVRKYQDWRRGKIEVEDYDDTPFEIGRAIDKVIELADFHVKNKRKINKK